MMPKWMIKLLPGYKAGYAVGLKEGEVIGFLKGVSAGNITIARRLSWFNETTDKKHHEEGE